VRHHRAERGGTDEAEFEAISNRLTRLSAHRLTRGDHYATLLLNDVRGLHTPFKPQTPTLVGGSADRPR